MCDSSIKSQKEREFVYKGFRIIPCEDTTVKVYRHVIVFSHNYMKSCM